MIKKKWNDNWEFKKGSPTMMEGMVAMYGGGSGTTIVQLPHDAMIHEERTADTLNQRNTGFYPGGVYTYKKKLFAEKSWKDHTVILEFEGIYQRSLVYVNDNLVASELYGYSNFYACLDKYIEYGKENDIVVIANNAAENNSRWYTGSGIYRNVNLYVGDRIHIPCDGVKIHTHTASETSSEIEVRTKVKKIAGIKEKVEVVTTIYYDEHPVAKSSVTVSMYPNETEKVHQRFGITDAKLWDTEHPNLYQCKVQIVSGKEVLDTTIVDFGIRTIELDPVSGLRVNGQPTKLRGTCLHHDNGIIGAAIYEDASDRKCRLLKEAGFNSIRSAHHPISKGMLDACDKYGMLVMDELSDMWTKYKNDNDYAAHFLGDVKTQIERMVAKDYNHPSVIIYSAGNEIPDLGTDRGAQINRHICNYFRALDHTRYTTNGINALLALGDKIGIIVKEMLDEMKKRGDHKEDGASLLNIMMGFMGGENSAKLAVHPLLTQTIKEATEGMDIIGLNYLTDRHELEHELHPNKTVIGTETYPADIARLWDIVERNPHVLGDFTWTGYDYLGEAGCGIFYYDGTQNFSGTYPDRLAYIGDINIIGYRRPISYLREIVYGLRTEPYIAVERVDKYGMKHSQTAWMLKDNIASWTWPGYEGRPAIVDVYSSADTVELLLNGKSLGKKRAGKAVGFVTTFKTSYEAGELVAISYVGGKKTGTHTLRTAGDEVMLKATVEGEVLEANASDLSFITIDLVDKDGTPNPFVSREVKVTVSGEGELLGFGSADPRAVGSYDSDTWTTYDGQVMAVIRSTHKAGKITVTFESVGCKKVVVNLKSRKI